MGAPTLGFISKKQIRDRFKKSRTSFYPSKPSSVLDVLCKQIITNIQTILTEELALQGRVASYKAFGSEVNLEGLCSLDSAFCYPRVDGTEIKFHPVLNSEDFAPNQWGILEPLAGSEEIQLQAGDVVLVPGLGFNRQGDRIGYGRGYYDRALQKTTAVKVGVAFSEQVTSELWEINSYDIPMDYIVTEKYILKTHIEDKS